MFDWFFSGQSIALYVIAVGVLILISLNLSILAIVARSRSYWRRQQSFVDSASELLDQGEYRAAIEDATTRLREYPEDVNARHILAHAAYRSGDLPRALRAFQRVDALRPDYDAKSMIVEIEAQMPVGDNRPSLHVVSPKDEPPLI